MFGLSQPMAHIVAKFFLEGREYRVDGFRIGFTQGVDHKGQPQHETRGGQLFLKLSQAGDPALFEWAKRSTLLKSGMIVFETGMSNPVLRVEFTDAYCISLTRTIHAQSGTQTSLIISPEVIKLNGMEHDNFWKR